MILTRRAAMAAVPLLIATYARAQAPRPVIQVVKSPTCGCCNGWIAHLRQAGFQVRVTDTADVTPTARRLGVPDDLRSCHTASVGDRGPCPRRRHRPAASPASRRRGHRGPRNADGLTRHGAWRPPRTLSGDIVHAGGAAIGVRVALIGRSRARLLNPVRLLS